MARVTGFTAARMRLIEAASIVKGSVNASGRLILEKFDGTTIDAGSVKGPTGPAGVGPVGSVVMHAGPSAPAGYLFCRGQTISRTTYASLFAAIGVTYGAGDGSTTFTLPNLQGRVPVGLDASQSEFDALAETGGAKTHTLTLEQMPSHRHVMNAHNHEQVVIVNNTTGGLAARYDYDGDGTAGRVYPQTGANTSSTVATMQDTGGGQAHNNLQPYLVMNYIIKT